MPGQLLVHPRTREVDTRDTLRRSLESVRPLLFGLRSDALVPHECPPSRTGAFANGPTRRFAMPIVTKPHNLDMPPHRLGGLSMALAPGPGPLSAPSATPSYQPLPMPPGVAIWITDVVVIGLLIVGVAFLVPSPFLAIPLQALLAAAGSYFVRALSEQRNGG